MNDYVSLAALFVSVLAFFITIYQSYLTRRHNILSVKPILSMERHIDYMTGILTITLSNYGTGPALIKEYELIDHGKKVEKFNHLSWAKLLESNGLSIINSSALNYYPGEPFGAGLNREIFKAYFSKEFASKKDLYIKTLSRISLHIEYNSIYDDKFILNETLQQSVD